MDGLQKVNNFSKNWGPLIAFVGVILSVFFYYLSKHNQEEQIDQSVKITSCINLITSNFIIQGEGKDLDYLSRYSTNIYWANWANVLNNYKSVKSRDIMASTIYAMESVNKHFDLMYYKEPFIGITAGNDEVKKFKKNNMEKILQATNQIKNNLEFLGFNGKNCEFAKEITNKVSSEYNI